MINGTCDPRFAAVRAAFAENFAERDEIGAAVCVVVDGVVVVDLWGGWADAAATRPWEADTLVNAFSVGKGLIATLFAQLVGTGAIDIDDPVATVWPEFAAAGKDRITIRQLLSHQAGLPAVRHRLPAQAMYDWPAMTTALAAEAPWWEPGTTHGYHVNTYGFLTGEVLRRVTGRSVGDLLRHSLTGPLGADIHIGLLPAQLGRVAEFVWPDEPPPEHEPAGLSDDELMRYNAYFNPSGLSGAGVINAAAWRQAELPSTNAHATARGVARVYTALDGAARSSRRIPDRIIDRIPDLVDPSALRAATDEQVHGPDRVLGRPSRFGLGFQLTQPERPLGPNAGAFGHFGAGGSLGFADPEAEVAFGYVMNQLGVRWQNPRNQALVDALYASLA